MSRAVYEPLRPRRIAVDHELIIRGAFCFRALSANPPGKLTGSPTASLFEEEEEQ